MLIHDAIAVRPRGRSVLSNIRAQVVEEPFCESFQQFGRFASTVFAHGARYEDVDSACRIVTSRASHAFSIRVTWDQRFFSRTA